VLVELVDGVVEFVLGVYYAAAPEDVVDDDEAAGGDFGEDGFPVVYVVAFVGVDEDEVEGAVEGGNGIECWAEAEFDFVSVLAFCPVALGHCGGFAVDVAGDDFSVRGEAFGEAEGAVAGEGADFEYAFRVAELGEHFQEAAFEISYLHDVHGHVFACFQGEFFEYFSATGGMCVGVVFDGFREDIGHWGAPAFGLDGSRFWGAWAAWAWVWTGQPPAHV